MHVECPLNFPRWHRVQRVQRVKVNRAYIVYYAFTHSPFDYHWSWITHYLKPLRRTWANPTRYTQASLFVCWWIHSPACWFERSQQAGFDSQTETTDEGIYLLRRGLVDHLFFFFNVKLVKLIDVTFLLVCQDPGNDLGYATRRMAMSSDSLNLLSKCVVNNYTTTISRKLHYLGRQCPSTLALPWMNEC